MTTDHAALAADLLADADALIEAKSPIGHVAARAQLAQVQATLHTATVLERVADLQEQMLVQLTHMRGQPVAYVQGDPPEPEGQCSICNEPVWAGDDIRSDYPNPMDLAHAECCGEPGPLAEMAAAADDGVVDAEIVCSEDCDDGHRYDEGCTATRPGPNPLAEDIGCTGTCSGVAHSFDLGRGCQLGL